MVRDAPHTLLMWPYDRCLLNWTNGGVGAQGLCRQRRAELLAFGRCGLETWTAVEHWQILIVFALWSQLEVFKTYI